VAADSTVRLIVDAAKAVNPLRAVKAGADKASQALERLKKKINDNEAAFRRLRRRATVTFGRIVQSAKKAAAATGKFGKAAIAAAAASLVEKILQLLQRILAPRQVRVSIKTAVSTVMCKQPMMLAPLRGLEFPCSCLNDIKPGISFSARVICFLPD